MFLHVTVVSYLEAYRIRVEFSDGVAKEVDLRAELYGEVFEPLKDVEFFKRVRVNSETNTIEWPNGADFAPEFLYEIGQESKCAPLGISRIAREVGVMANDAKVCRPNIFRYATKELSQDAMICWLIAWAGQNENTCVNEDQAALRARSRHFVQALLNHKRAERVQFDGDIKTEIHQQEQSIDILVRITDTITGKQYVLLIEDKTGAGDHGDQLERYYEAVVGGETKLGPINRNNVYLVYLKTGNQSLDDDKRIECKVEGQECEYKVFHRRDFLEVLNSYSGSHSILVDFREHLREIEERTESYRNWTREENRGEYFAWEGLYRRLEYELRKGVNEAQYQWMGWGDVSNPSGGFIGFWWQPRGMNEKCPLYLQLEVSWWKGQGNLCFKVDAGGKSSEEQSEMKWKWHKRVCDAGEQYVVRPKKMRIGETITVAEWAGEWLAFDEDSELLDIDETVKNLKQAEVVLTQAVEDR